MAQSSLSDLCSICYTDAPKYRCPRCNTRTCSLPCYKRHQQRASCSGKRDPAAYLKKSLLATPASIDRDYNYLKGIERNIDDASVDARERGVGARGHPHDPQSRNSRREGAYQRYLLESGITVNRAPKGMSRQKTNQSRVTKNGKIYWSIEWRDQNGEQDLHHAAEHDSTLSNLYRGVQAVRRKRKNVSSLHGRSDQALPKKRKVSSDPSTEVDEQSVAAKLETQPTAERPTTALSEKPMIQKPGTDPQRKENYYLLKQSTSGPYRVLIPLDSDQTLTKALQGQTVQEYPTIYVLQHSPSALPTGFISLDNYRASLKTDFKATSGAQSAADQPGPALHPRKTDQTENEGELDTKAILEILRRDVRG